MTLSQGSWIQKRGMVTKTQATSLRGGTSQTPTPFHAHSRLSGHFRPGRPFPFFPPHPATHTRASPGSKKDYNSQNAVFLNYFSQISINSAVPPCGSGGCTCLPFVSGGLDCEQRWPYTAFVTNIHTTAGFWAEMIEQSQAPQFGLELVL